MIQQKFVNADGLQIAYRERNAHHQPTIIFIHGNSSSSRFWYKQMDDVLFDDCRLIALDLPGHGASDASSVPRKDYSVKGLGRIVAAAINALEVKDYITVGISLGTNVVVEAMSYGMSPRGLVLLSPSVLGGQYTMDSVFRQEEDVRFLFTHELDRLTIRRCYDVSFPELSSQDRTRMEEDYFNVRAPFRSMLAETAAAGEIQDEISILQKYEHAVLIIFGLDEKLLHINYLDQRPFSCWSDQIFKLAGGHFLNLDNTTEVNELMRAYINDIYRNPFSDV